MTASTCPYPATCPVPDIDDLDQRRLRLTYLEADEEWSHVHDAAHPPPAFNTSHQGDTRFAPLDDVGHLYLARRATVALLETVFHDVHETADRIIYTATALAGRQLSPVTVSTRLPVLDLRDPQLHRLGLDRGLVTSSRAHYPCTRRWAQTLLAKRLGPTTTVGWIWNSRIAELAQADSPLLDDLLTQPADEVTILYDRHIAPGSLDSPGPRYDDLTNGQGWVLCCRVAEQLDAEVH